jgi:hypothetical protein
MAGGLTAGIGEGRPKTPTKNEQGLTQSASTVDDESVEGLTTICAPINAAPTHSTTTTIAVSVSLPVRVVSSHWSNISSTGQATTAVRISAVANLRSRCDTPAILAPAPWQTFAFETPLPPSVALSTHQLDSVSALRWRNSCEQLRQRLRRPQR